MTYTGVKEKVKLTSFLRMWNKICLSYDFGENEARVAFSGEVSDLIRDPVTKPNMQGITFMLGRHCFVF